MNEVDWDKVVGVIAIAGIAIAAMFQLPDSGTEIATPAIAAIAGFVTGRAASKP